MFLETFNLYLDPEMQTLFLLNTQLTSNTLISSLLAEELRTVPGIEHVGLYRSGVNFPITNEPLSAVKSRAVGPGFGIMKVDAFYGVFHVQPVVPNVHTHYVCRIPCTVHRVF